MDSSSVNLYIIYNITYKYINTKEMKTNLFSSLCNNLKTQQLF